MVTLTALAVGVAVPPANASVLSSQWTEVNWCAPNACDATAQFGVGMTVAHFKASGGVCPSVALTATVPVTLNSSGKTGWSQPPSGFIREFLEPIRYVFGEPRWCTNAVGTATANNVMFPVRIFSLETDNSGWEFPASRGSFSLGFQLSNTIELTCISSTGTLNSATGGGTVGTTGSPSNDKYTPTRFTPLGYGVYEYVQVVGTPVLTLLNNPTNCAAIRSITVTAKPNYNDSTYTVTHEWSANRALSGEKQYDYYSAENPNCDSPLQNRPIECDNLDVSPAALACRELSLDPATWGYIAGCVIGTPEDYLAGSAVGADDLDGLPVPGTGTCAAWTLGNIYGQPFVIDVCSWYPGVRPWFDVILVASIWVSVAAGFFRTKNGT